MTTPLDLQPIRERYEKATERLAGKLKRYEFDERANDEQFSFFPNEIAAAHPMNWDISNPAVDARYCLASEMVSERHAKYSLIDMTHWLLTERDTLTAQLSEARRDGQRLDWLEQSRVTVQASGLGYGLFRGPRDYWGENIRAAIDAAMSASSQTGKGAV
jgi:hypothetical protein